MLQKLLHAFGCWHTQYSFPITGKHGPLHKGMPSRTGTYVVCRDCAKDLTYDWRRMRVADDPRLIHLG